MRTLSRLAGALGAAGALILFTATAALGQAVDGTTPGDAPVGAIFTLDDSWTYVLTGLVLPVVTGLLVRESNPGWVKVGLAGAVATVVTSFLEIVQDDGSALLSQEWGLKTLVTFAISVFTYANVYRPIASGRFNGERLARVYPFPDRPAHSAYRRDAA